MSCRRDRPDAGGFTLVETVVALFLLAFGMVAGAELIALTCRSASLARCKGSAAIIADGKASFLADLHRRDPAAAELTLGDHGPELAEIWNRATDRVLDRYRIIWTVSRISDPRPGKLQSVRQVWITVYPTDALGRWHMVPWMNKTTVISIVLSARFM